MKRKEGTTFSKSCIESDLPGEAGSIRKELLVHFIDFIAIRIVTPSGIRVPRSTVCKEVSMLEHNDLPNFEQAVLPHLDAAYNLARWLTRNEQDAQDIVQEAYLRAFRFFPAFRGGDAHSWIMKIVRNTCYTWLHENRPLRGAVEFDENLFHPDSRIPNPEEAVLQKDSGTLVRKALEMLPTNFREVLVLRELDGMSYKEIAEITCMAEGTVMSSLSRARGRLRQALKDLMIGENVQSSPQILPLKA
jgi:RNA polymerase sigma-70 factor (ECF subfamily)